MSTFDSTKTGLATLLNDIVVGKIQLPDFQRGWVWDDEHIRSLLVSIARAFPVGAIMLLEAGGDAKFKARPIEGVDLTKAILSKLEKLILDGQQRLTSLTQVLMFTQPVQTRDYKKKLLHRYYYIDIETALLGKEHYESAIISVDTDRTVRENFGRDLKLDLSTPEKEYENFYFPCNQLLNSDEWEEGLLAYDVTKFGRYAQFRKQVVNEFRNYNIPIIELSKENKKEAVCLVFEKVNTGGVSLSVFELMTATYAIDNVNLRDEWFGNAHEGIEGTQPHLRKQSLLREVQPTEFLQGLTLLYTWDKRREDLKAGKTGKQVTGVTAKREAVLSLPLDAYQKWKQPKSQGYWKAAKFLRQESFFSTNDLPYRTQLVPLAVVMAFLGDRWLEPKIYDKIARWFWCGILGELYGGAVETRIALDIQELIDWIEGSKEEPSTVRDANFQPTRLGTLRSRNSAAYKGINVLVQREGAQDFFWKVAIRDLDETDWEERKLDIHHIFPKSWCDKQSIPASRYNSILNKTPISFKANRMIGGKAPSEYLVQLQKHDSVQLDDAGMNAILATHQIDAITLRQDDFEGFMASRQRMILAKIEAAMGKPVLAVDDSAYSDVTDEEE
ncbi:GmrSD restriction endonuclease domain-containing protein [Nostoc sp.]|uniref:GmrSD restriction endonuclease domain-containing protein n=1 Tax=Nostoc sp. TaxID=1180 RepID=UPI002FFBA6F9